MEQNSAKRLKLLVAVTGSVAAIKIPELIQSLTLKFEVKLIFTQSSKQFISQYEVNSLSIKGVECLSDQDEKIKWKKRGDPVLHIQLRKWADAMIIAPLSANTLAKISNGLCDNIVTLICRCWDMKVGGSGKLLKPMIIAPAMNTMMWVHPITEEQVNRLRNWGYVVVDPIEKVLMCGDQGKGAMANLQTIINGLEREVEQMKEYSEKITQKSIQ